MSEDFNLGPEFTGVFIPACVWLNQDLNCVERCLLAEIGALGGHRGDCRAGNEFLGRHVGVGAGRVSSMIAKLTDLGLVKIESFDGRVRRLRVFYDSKADYLKTVRQTTQKQLGRLPENSKEVTRSLVTRDLVTETTVAVAPVRRFSDGWIAAFKLKFGEVYRYQTKDGVQASRLLKDATPEEALETAKKAWNQTDERKFWNCVHRSRDVASFVSNYTKIRLELKAQVPRTEYKYV